MLQLAQPWMLLLLPAPLLVWWLVPARREAQTALHAPFLDRLSRASGELPSTGAVVRRRPWTRAILLAIIWAALVLSLARPQRLEPPVVISTPARDILLAVDLSGSMETRDMKDANGRDTDRLSVVKEVLNDFLAKRQGDRIGLVFFGNAPFLQAPFTEDLNACRALLAEAQVRMAGPRTMLGDAIGYAVNVFARSEVKEKVLILLTDGNDTGSSVPPVKAAEIAKNHGITVHPIAMGDPTTTGEDKFDEPTLQAIATTTGGRYFRATDRNALTQVYAELDRLTPHKVQTFSHRPITDLYHWPLALATVVSLVAQVIMLSRASFHAGLAAGASPGLPAPVATLCWVLPLCWTSIAAVSWGTLQRFHFLRPHWLWLLFPAIGILWWTARSRNLRHRWNQWMDPLLLDALLIKNDTQRRLSPTLVLGLAWLLGITALAGPSWRQKPATIAASPVAVTLVVKVTPSMLTKDLAPDRLHRSMQKISDFMAERPGAAHSLIAYSGSAHLVMPRTTDPDVIKGFCYALSPELMPQEGDNPEAALTLAQQQCAAAPQGGAILWMADDVPEDFVPALARHQHSGGVPVSLLATLPDPIEFPETKPSGDLLSRAAAAGGGIVILATPDPGDVKQLARHLEHAATAAGGDADSWRDEGHTLLPLLAFVGLFWFRRGWVILPSTT